METRKKGINDPSDYSWLRSNKVMKKKFYKQKICISFQKYINVNFLIPILTKQFLMYNKESYRL